MPQFELGPEQIRTTTYDGSSHITVLFQLYGSVWPNVFPFCIVNILLTALVYYLYNNGIDLSIKETGHNFMAIMVSFLVVSRAQIVYGRYMSCMEHLTGLLKSCRELSHHTAVLTIEDMSDGAKKWRREVARKTIIFVKKVITAMEQNNRREHSDYVMIEETSHLALKFAHGVRTSQEENFRAPSTAGLELYNTIIGHRAGGKDTLKKPMQVNEMLKLLGHVEEGLNHFTELETLLVSPYPFPLVQMARTFLFFWVYTLPFALVGNFKNLVVILICMFFVTYGFIGLEYVSMEMDDPFGDDPNDFDDLHMAQLAFEDIYITLYKIDGPESADYIRKIIDEVFKESQFHNEKIEV